MIADAHEHLIQDVLAGEATAARAAELERLIASDPKARARYEEMRELFRMLAEAAVAQPPAELHSGIMRAIATEPTRAANVRRHWNPAPVFGAFLAGAAAASLIVVAALRGPGGGAAGPGSGTMAPLETTPGAVISRATLMTGNGRIECSTSRAGDDVRLELHVAAGRPVDLELTFASEALALTGLRWSRHPEGPVSATAGRVTLAGAVAGDCTLTLHARGDTDAPIQVLASGSGSVLLHTASQRRGG